MRENMVYLRDWKHKTNAPGWKREETWWKARLEEKEAEDLGDPYGPREALWSSVLEESKSAKDLGSICFWKRPLQLQEDQLGGDCYDPSKRR